MSLWIQIECSPSTALLMCAIQASLFVSSIYIWHGSITQSRNHPSTIIRRFVSVSVISCVAPLFHCYCGTFVSVSDTTVATAAPLSRWLGLPFQVSIVSWLYAFIVPLCLCAILFLGPLLQYVLEFNSLSQCLQWSLKSALSADEALIRVRNLLVV